MNLLKRLAYAAGFAVTRRTPPAAVAALLESIRPVATEHPLIRIGGDGDGGYLVPDDLAGLAACFSPGVDVTARFEAELVARGVRCFQADGSVAASPLAGEPLVEFDPTFLGIADDAATITLDRWVEDKLPGGSDDLLLQMDIEGHEWLVLAAAAEATLARFRIMVIELHGLHHVHEPFGFAVIAAVLAKLLRQFRIVHAHPNNVAGAIGPRGRAIPPFIEYTFHRADRIASTAPARVFPHPLDRDNVAGPSLVLPGFMHG